MRKEDKTIRPFTIPSQPELIGEIIKITSFSVIRNHKATTQKANISLKEKHTCFFPGQTASASQRFLNQSREALQNSFISPLSRAFIITNRIFQLSILRTQCAILLWRSPMKKARKKCAVSLRVFNNIGLDANENRKSIRRSKRACRLRSARARAPRTAHS